MKISPLLSIFILLFQTIYSNDVTINLDNLNLDDLDDLNVGDLREQILEYLGMEDEVDIGSFEVDVSNAAGVDDNNHESTDTSVAGSDDASSTFSLTSALGGLSELFQSALSGSNNNDNNNVLTKRKLKVVLKKKVEAPSPTCCEFSTS